MKLKLDLVSEADRIVEATRKRLELLQLELPDDPTMADLQRLARKHFLDDPTTLSVLAEQLQLASKKPGKKNMPSL